MPRSDPKMSWDVSHGRRRWLKQYKGKKHAVSVEQLRAIFQTVIPETKDGSRPFADRWWEAKKASLDLQTPAQLPPPAPQEKVLARLLGVPEHRPTAEDLLSVQAFVDPDADAEHLEHRRSDLIAGAIGKLIGEMIHPEHGELAEEALAKLAPAEGAALRTAIVTLRGESAAPAERTVRGQFEKWVKRQQDRVADGSLAVARADNLRIQLEHFRKFLGDETDVVSIGGEQLYGFVQWCRSKVQARRDDPEQKAGWSDTYADKTLDTAKVFLRFLWKQALIELPREIDDPEFCIRVRPKVIETWPISDVKRIINRAPGQLKLHLLLMTNCGFTQKAISDLKEDAFDARKGYLTFKRTKTEGFADVPTVRYRLWPSTLTLLKIYGKRGAERLLLTESGKPFVRDELVNGRRKRADNIASNYAHLKEDLPLKGLRKTGATLLAGHKDYRSLDQLWLGHSPRSVAQRHYSAPPQKLLDEAVAWLGRKLLLDKL